MIAYDDHVFYIKNITYIVLRSAYLTIKKWNRVSEMNVDNTMPCFHGRWLVCFFFFQYNCRRGRHSWWRHGVTNWPQAVINDRRLTVSPSSPAEKKTFFEILPVHLFAETGEPVFPDVVEGTTAHSLTFTSVSIISCEQNTTFLYCYGIQFYFPSPRF